ncbi:MAG: hypothetical protein AAFN10_20945 [Bacteroidota bacterium]
MDIGFVMDIMMAVLGFAAAAVIGVYVWRMWAKPETVKQNTLPSKETTPVNKAKNGTTKVVPIKPLVAPTPKATTVSQSDAPYLKAIRLQLKSESELQLILQNQNGTINLEKVEVGENNELAVVFEPSLTQKAAHVYSPQQEISLHLKGEKVIFKTYEFWLYFKNSQGQRFRQQIAGLGKEYPIVEKAQVAGW